MCGLVGAAGVLDKVHLTALGYLGNLVSLRGDDSTGIMDYTPNHQTPYTLFKTLSASDEVFAWGNRYWTQYYTQRWKTKLPTAVAVHARMATMGQVTKQNAHPFQHKHIIGMHNGTIRNEFEFKKEFATDSEAVMKNIAVKGDSFLLDLQKMYGAAYALVWINQKENTINFYRNEDRPLWFWTSHDKKAVFWASDEKWLQGVLPYFTGLKGTLETLRPDYKITLPLNGKSPVEEVRKEHITSFRVPNKEIEKHLEEGDKSFGLGTVYHRPDTRYNKTCGKWLTHTEEAQFWKKLDERVRLVRESIEKRTEGEQKVIPFEPGKSNQSTIPRPSTVKQIITTNGQQIELTKTFNNSTNTWETIASRPIESDINIAQTKFNETDRDKMVVGKDGVVYFETTSNCYVNEKFYRRILAEGCRACDHEVKLYDDVQFLSTIDFLCETCKHDAMVAGMVEQEVKDEQAQIRSGARQPRIVANEAAGEEDWSYTDDSDDSKEKVVTCH